MKKYGTRSGIGDRCNAHPHLSPRLSVLRVAFVRLTSSMPISRISRDFCTRRGRTLAPQKVSPVARLVMREVGRIRSDLTVGVVSIFSIVPNCQFVCRATRNVCCTCHGNVAAETQSDSREIKKIYSNKISSQFLFDTFFLLPYLHSILFVAVFPVSYLRIII